MLLALSNPDLKLSVKSKLSEWLCQCRPVFSPGEWADGLWAGVGEEAVRIQVTQAAPHSLLGIDGQGASLSCHPYPSLSPLLLGPILAG